MRRARSVTTSLLSVAVAALLLSACTTSVAGLRRVADDMPGVTRVEVGEGGGDDDIPFADPPRYVTVWMEPDASAEQVLAVFDAYGGDIDGGDVSSVDAVLGGPTQATLSAGEGVHVTEAMVDDLVGAQADPAIVEYRFEAYPVLPGVSIMLAQAGFDGVVAMADRYRDRDDLELVEVVSEGFVLVRDEGNEDLRVTDARQAVVERVGSRYELRGATVSGRGPLELVVAPADVRAVRRLAAEAGERARVGRVVVHAGGWESS